MPDRDLELAKELAVSARHEATAPVQRASYLIAKIASRVRPAGVDALATEERDGNLTVRRSGTLPVERL